MATIRLTMAQALVRYLAAQTTEFEGQRVPLFAGVWAIFGHGNVAGLGEALAGAQDDLPTYRAHNEQAMAHAAIAFAKACRRRRMMACTTSIGPGATNMVTAAALAHVNRLPVLFLPGDVFATRRPDPVLQQIEDFADGTVSANDCFRPVSRLFDRITRPEQILAALPRAMAVLTDPAACGPVTLALCQDIQAEAFDYPAAFFAPALWRIRRPPPDAAELAEAAAAIRAAQAPLIIAGGGVQYAEATGTLAGFAERHAIPVAETQAGKGTLPDTHRLNLGAIGVTGTAAANQLAERADLILAVGTRLSDFTTGSWALFRNPARRLIGLNVQQFDATKHHALPLVADAQAGLEALSAALSGHTTPAAWGRAAAEALAAWHPQAAAATAPSNAALPSDAQVIGAVQRSAGDGCHRGVRGRRSAGRAAQAVACREARFVSSGIWLFLHGIRNRRRAGGEAGAAGCRGDCHGGRRQLSDDELGDRDVCHARVETDDRGARQRRFRLHRPAAARHRRGVVQQSVRRHKARHAAAHRFPRPCRKPGGGCRACRGRGGARGRAGPCTRRAANVGGGD